MARLPQPGRKVDEAWREHQSLGVDHPVGLAALSGNPAVGDEELAASSLPLAGSTMRAFFI